MTAIDLRSDTVTRPTAAMYAAMTAAPLGDDVFGDDPTVIALQQCVADLLGKEAALYVPSGTMSNQLALRAQTQPGNQIVCEAGAHVYNYEAGAPAALSGVLVSCVATDDAVMHWSDVASVLNPDDYHFAQPALVCLENTHNRGGGRVLPQAAVVEIGREARARGLRVHLDGARLWNAHAASDRPLAELAAPADTVSVCFSKGLGAPVGSCLLGDAETVARARVIRKQWGGGMRQAGVLAAACLHALDEHLPRLAADHARASRLADELDHPALRPAHAVETNIVILAVAEPATPEDLLAHLQARGVMAVGFGPGRVRLVTHLGIDDAAIDATVAALNAFGA